MRALISIILIAIAQSLPAQTIPTQVLEQRIATLEKQVADLQQQIQAADKSVVTISDPGSQASILLSAAGGKPVIKFVDGQGNQIAEIGYSEWWQGPLLTIQQGEEKAYFWSGAALPSKRTWADIRLMAEYNCHSYLTDKLLKESLTVSTLWDSDLNAIVVNVFVDTSAQTTWNYYSGLGRFSISDREVRSAYADAAGALKKDFISGIYDAAGIGTYKVRIYFTIRGFDVGVWLDGSMKLAGE